MVSNAPLTSLKSVGDDYVQLQHLFKLLTYSLIYITRKYLKEDKPAGITYNEYNYMILVISLEVIIFVLISFMLKVRPIMFYCQRETSSRIKWLRPTHTAVD